MTCRDCEHHTVCRNFRKDVVVNMTRDCEEWCPHFKTEADIVAEAIRKTASEIVKRLREADAYFDDYQYDQMIDDIALDYGVEEKQ